jgi:hypothetical protein
LAHDHELKQLRKRNDNSETDRIVSLGGVMEAPEGWANFDAEATAFAIEQRDNYDAFVMGRVTYEKFSAN